MSDWNDRDLNEAILYFNGLSDHRTLLESQVLYEGSAKKLLINLVQAAAGAGLDIASVGVPLDTIVDVLVASVETKFLMSQIEDLKQAGSVMLQGSNITQKIADISLTNGAAPIYDNVKNIVSDAVIMLQKAGENPSEKLKAYSQKMHSAVENGSQAVGDWIAAMIPDVPGIDILISKLFEVGLENSYSSAAKIFDTQIPEQTRALFTDPKKLEDLLFSVTVKLISGLKKAQGMNNLPGFLGKLGSAGIQKTIGFLENTVVTQIPNMVKIVHDAIPFVFAAGALVQIVYNEDYESEEVETQDDETHTESLRKALSTILESDTIMSEYNGDLEEMAVTGAVQGFTEPVWDDATGHRD